MCLCLSKGAGGLVGAQVPTESRRLRRQIDLKCCCFPSAFLWVPWLPPRGHPELLRLGLGPALPSSWFIIQEVQGCYADPLLLFAHSRLSLSGLARLPSEGVQMAV